MDPECRQGPQVTGAASCERGQRRGGEDLARLHEQIPIKKRHNGIRWIFN